VRLQGVALLGELSRSEFVYFGKKLNINMGTPSQLEAQSYAHRIYVLAHLVYDDTNGKSPTASRYARCLSMAPHA
jgi:hypothetical protein